MCTTKSVEQLENQIWPNPDRFETTLVQKVHEYRKIPIAALSIEQLRILISQNVGHSHLICLVINILENNALAEGDLFPGDLLSATLSLNEKFWASHPDDKRRLLEIIQHQKAVFEKITTRGLLRQISDFK